MQFLGDQGVDLFIYDLADEMEDFFWLFVVFEELFNGVLALFIASLEVQIDQIQERDEEFLIKLLLAAKEGQNHFIGTQRIESVLHIYFFLAFEFSYKFF